MRCAPVNAPRLPLTLRTSPPHALVPSPLSPRPPLTDGAETDLDLGHYERFTSAALTRASSASSGQVYETVITNERAGRYLGKTVQVIPHVTNEIKRRITAAGQGADILITEIGGTTGDIEGLPFLEALRQFQHDAGRGNVAFIHCTLVPYIAAAGELKTKPSQQSVAKLREIGLFPDLLICRSDRPIGDDHKSKLSLYCNVAPEAVVECIDVKTSIYELPLALAAQGADAAILRRLGLPGAESPAPVDAWEEVVRRLASPATRVRIAVVGKYIELQDAYKSVYEAITHGGIAHAAAVDVTRVDAEELEAALASGGDAAVAAALAGASGILVPGGFGSRGTEGKIAAARYARVSRVPYLGLCLGMQLAVVEFARSVAGLAGASSSEFDPPGGAPCAHPVITAMEGQAAAIGTGGTMRLGAYECALAPGSVIAAAYGKETVSERHRHRFEFNPAYRSVLEGAGLVIGGVNPATGLVEAVELPSPSVHPFFVGVQSHPEFKSKPTAPHPLFAAFVGAAIKHGAGAGTAAGANDGGSASAV